MIDAQQWTNSWKFGLICFLIMVMVPLGRDTCHSDILVVIFEDGYFFVYDVFKLMSVSCEFSLRDEYVFCFALLICTSSDSCTLTVHNLKIHHNKIIIIFIFFKCVCILNLTNVKSDLLSFFIFTRMPPGMYLSLWTSQILKMRLCRQTGVLNQYHIFFRRVRF